MPRLMRALGIAIVRGLAKGLVLGLTLGLVLTYALRWPMPTGSLLGYLAAMAACGTTGIAGGHAPWREGAWLVAALKCVAGVGVGALLYWALCAHGDASLPAEIVSLLALPSPALAEDGSLSWIAIPAFSLTAVTTAFGLLVEIDHVGGDHETPQKKAEPKKSAGATQPAKKAAPLARTVVENADTETEDRPAQTRRARPADTTQ